MKQKLLQSRSKEIESIKLMITVEFYVIRMQALVVM